MARPGRRKRAESRYTEQAERLAARLRALREQRGMTQEQLAARAEISVATVRNIERMVVVEPSLFTVLAMVQVLGTSIEDVITVPSHTKKDNLKEPPLPHPQPQ